MKDKFSECHFPEVGPCWDSPLLPSQRNVSQEVTLVPTASSFSRQYVASRRHVGCPEQPTRFAYRLKSATNNDLVHALLRGIFERQGLRFGGVPIGRAVLPILDFSRTWPGALRSVSDSLLFLGPMMLMSSSVSHPTRWFLSLFGTAVLALVMAWPAQAQIGQSSALFLRIEPDSRAAGMGNAGVAVADNANAMFWNPSGLAYQETTQAGLTHSNWLPEFNANLFYEYLVGTYHVDGIGTFGGNVTFLNLGETEIRNGAGQEIGITSSYQLAVGTSYGVKVSERLGVGTSFRYIYSKLTSGQLEGTGDGAAQTFATDFSALYRSAPFTLGGSEATFSAGVNLANMGGTLDFNKQRRGKDPIPMNLRFGPALTLDFDEYNSLTITTDFNKELVNVDEEIAEGDTFRVGDPGYVALFKSWGTASGQAEGDEVSQLSLMEQFTVGTGIEYWYSDLFALRTGYFYEDPDNGDRQFLTFGAGLRYNIVGVDISYLYTAENQSPLANTLRFSLLFDFQ